MEIAAGSHAIPTIERVQQSNEYSKEIENNFYDNFENQLNV